MPVKKLNLYSTFSITIPKREEPGKTGAPCVKVPGSSRVPSTLLLPHAHSFVKGPAVINTHTRFLLNLDNKALDSLYKKWSIKLDRFTDKINVSLFTREELIPYNSYFDPDFQSAWENKVYNLHLPPDFSKFKSIFIIY